ncbi:MAG: 50S ribosomal protein L22, partial [Actinomycetota bacterium]
MAASVQNRPGTKAKVKFVRMSASKVRVVLNLIRGKQVGEAREILQFSERLAAQVIAKALDSAVANAEHNEDIPEDELFISACFADEGPTLKRFRPRARGRAGRIHKQTCHITIEVARLTDEELDGIRSVEELKSQSRSSRAASKSGGGDRAARVAKSRAA